ncbi:hypothetical protein FB45DRAFT_1072642 [Roridomyces roridus]|uniref:BTB domain-containing protein n=1 Tax=Roridomyces roridus TaxID=1738132 RepID=A0AAD7AXC5_9AGAR|nr:hypothetical protein FB45DRAFT_1072642 [Roridomyces roridus]
MDVGAATEPKRAQGLWFEDCGLVIQAEDVLFRVSRDFLAAHSPVFRDMLSVPTPANAETREGCPFVSLPDTAQDFTVFLKALLYYDFFEPPPAQTTCDILFGVLRMSHKYGVDPLRKRALAHIALFHPTTIDEYELTAANPLPSSHWMEELLRREGGLPMIPLARQLSLDWMLPVAFYRVCQHAKEAHVLHDLSADDQLRYILACRMLETGEVSKILNFLWMPIDECSNDDPPTCNRIRIGYRRFAEERRVVSADLASKLPLDVWTSKDCSEMRVCAPCLRAMMDAHGAAKRSFWDRLPSFFGLPNWEELEKMKSEAFE